MTELDLVGRVVTEEWCAALQLETATPDDDFFMLGGNSLLAVSLIENVEQRLGIAFPVEALFVHGTLDAVIDACAATALGHTATEAVDASLS